MTHGEKMIWAAAFIAERNSHHPDRIGQWGIDWHAGRSAEVASNTVDLARIAAHRIDENENPDVARRLKEMLND